MKQLDDRLQAVAAMVPPGSRLADVGTDHGLLPIALVQAGVVPHAIASDVVEGPLSAARAGVLRAGLTEQIETRLSDGLDAVAPEEVDWVVMAGMGGRLILQLIERASWLQNPAKTLVLQPMTDAPLVREQLYGKGFELADERAAMDRTHVYTVMTFRYGGRPQTITPVFRYTGLLPRRRQAAEAMFLQRQRQRLQQQYRGLLHTGKDPQTAQMLADVIAFIQQWEQEETT